MGVTRLVDAATIEEQWRGIVGPWLREKAATAWQDERPTVILTPSRAESFYLRGRLLAEGIAFLGLRFWTPSDARSFLRREILPGVIAATQAELRLLARSCAESLLQHTPADAATLGSVVQEPGPFLRAYDLLLGAGWDPARHGAVYGQKLAETFARELAGHDIATQAGMHRAFFRQKPAPGLPLIADLLVVGFNATHWPLWDLLRAAVVRAERTTVALTRPRVFGEEIDQLWISSWEEAAESEVTPAGFPDEEDGEMPFAALAASYERGTARDVAVANLTFLVAPDLAAQVEAVALQAIRYLRSEDCTRLGIVFPEAGALALGVASRLRELGIPLDDGTGAIRPGLFETRSWQSWLAWQEESSVTSFTAWLRAGEAQGMPGGLEAPLTARRVAEVLENALGETLIDDLGFLALHLEEGSSDRDAAAVAAFLRKRKELPETATFADFLEVTIQALKSLGWKAHLARLQIEPPPWLRHRGTPLSRRSYLEWLRETTDSRERVRGTEGNHFYGKVHLLIYAQMTGQIWSHLILTGLNDGDWPRLFETGAFGSRHELAALNRQARELNRLGTHETAQGAGQEAVRFDRGHCLLPQERFNLALRDLCAALEGTQSAVCLAAMTTAGGRSLVPSDFFEHAWQVAMGDGLDDATFQQLAAATAEWLGKQAALLVPSPGDLPRDLDQTRMAYEARRDVSQPFGPYEFSFREPPKEPIQLPCKTWETAWNHPASVWLEKIVGVSPWPEGGLSWPRAVGTWVHRWMTLALRSCEESGGAGEFPALLRTVIERESARLRDRVRATELELYPWWNQVNGQARSITLGLGERLAPQLEGKQLLSEFRLPGDLKIALPGTDRTDFALIGRIDLLLMTPGIVPNDPRRGDFSGCTGWVIDFKTGSASPLSATRVGKGQGLQAILYALAIRAGGASPVVLSLHTFDEPLKPQIDLENVLEIEPLFRSLDIFHRAGIFGQRGNADSAYGFAPTYPMATRFVPGSVLEAKWALVHGGEAPAAEGAE